jgi:pyroglutamyl-peptidase
MSISYETHSSKILLTSFDTWLPHHQSNSSDDLLGHLQEHYLHPQRLDLLRKLPVDIETASQLTINRIEEIKPNAIASAALGAIVCCGMAEGRSNLTVESRASCDLHTLHTAIDVNSLIDGLHFTEVSHDAGKFVCEGLYYQILKYLQSSSWQIPCIFIHVPVLNSLNQSSIISDFTHILARI